MAYNLPPQLDRKVEGEGVYLFGHSQRLSRFAWTRFTSRVRGSSAGGFARVFSARGMVGCEEEVVVGGQGGKTCLWSVSFDQAITNLYTRY